MSERRLVRINDDEIPVTIEDDRRVEVRGERLEVGPAETGTCVVRTADGLKHPVHLIAAADVYWVHIDGAVFTMTMGRGSQGRTARRVTAAGELTAPMPATVLSIVASPGQTVQMGDPVLILEAMKMELPVRAPRDGTVTAVHCRAGDLVQAGVSLAEIS